MSITTLRTLTPLVATDQTLSPVAECAACGSAMESTPNPYFGTGLATHRYVALCTGCYHVAFVPEPEQVPSRAERFVGAVRNFFNRAA